MSEWPFDEQLDAQGLVCPEPVMLLHTKARTLAAGATLMVIATDPSTERDVPKFCRFLGFELLHQVHDEQCYRYWIRKPSV